MSALRNARGEPPKICLIAQEFPPTLGGVAVAARRLATLLVEAGCRVHVVNPFEGERAGLQEGRRDEEGAAIHRVRVDWIPGGAGDYALRRLLRALDEEIGFDLFHGFFLTVAHPAVLAARAQKGRAARPTIASIRGGDALTLIDHPYCRPMILFALQQATWVTSVSQLYLDRVARSVPLDGRASVIRNGVSAPPDGARFALDEARRGVVGTVGELRLVKDAPLLIRAYAALLPARRRKLLLAGFFSSDEEQEWSNVLIDEFGLAAEVELTGRFPHAERWRHLARMHVYAQSSGFEGFPNALLEAAALGVPLVATAVGGVKEVLRDREDALLVPHGDPRALAAAIAAILDDDALALRLSDASRRLAARLSHDAERDQWRALYQRLLSAPTT